MFDSLFLAASYKVEGIGYDFIPIALDHEVVDLWIKSEDNESFNMSRKVIREEGMIFVFFLQSILFFLLCFFSLNFVFLFQGILCGGSSGSVFAAAMVAAKDLREDQRCVVLCADSIRYI